MSNQYFVYNPFDRFSMLAAAVMKNRTKGIIFKSTERLPVLKEDDTIEYYNMEPYKEIPKSVQKKRETGNHLYVNSQIWSDDQSEIEVGVDVFANACNAYQINASNHGNINHLVTEMYTNNLTLTELIVLYKNIKAAKHALAARNVLYIPFNFNVDSSNRNDKNHFSTDEKDEFFSYIETLKQKAERNNTIQFVECKGRFYRTVITFFSDEDYFWLRRLFNLGNKHYANVFVTQNGCNIDTNLESVKNFQVDLMCHKSNEFFQR